MKTILIATLSLWLSVTTDANLIIKKWNFNFHEWHYVGAYHCSHRGELRFHTNSEINFWRVAHYNEHQRFDNFTRLWVLLSDGTYGFAHSIESRGRGNLYFASNTAMQRFLSNLTS